MRSSLLHGQLPAAFEDCGLSETVRRDDGGTGMILGRNENKALLGSLDILGHRTLSASRG